MRHGGHESDDRDVLNAAVVASLLTALFVELRHRQQTVAVAHEHDRVLARARRTRFLLETWMLTGVCLLILVIAQGGLH
jgi:hypothetical protein